MSKPLKNNQKNCIQKNMLILLVVLVLYYPLNAQNTSLQIDTALKRANTFKDLNVDSVFYYANSAYNLSKRINLPKKEYASLLVLAKTNIKIGDYGEAISNLLKAKKIVEQNEFTEFYVEADMLIGASYLAIGFSNDALKFFLEAQNKVTVNSKFNIQINLDYYTAKSYIEIKNIATANDYLHSSIALAISNNYPLGAYKSYILLANTSTNGDTINKYISLADNIIIQHPELLYEKAILRNNQALLNKALGNFELSKTQYFEAIKMSIDNGYQDHLAKIYNNYAYLLMAEKKLDSVAIVLSEALAIAKTIQSTNLQASIYDSYSDYFSLIRDYKNALIYKDSSIIKRRKSQEEQRIQESLFLSAVFETEQKEKEIINKEKEILEQENQINRLWVMQLAGIASLIFVIGLVVYFRQKSLLSKSRLLTVEKNKELEIVDAMIKGQDSERERLAMDLHDGLGASLSAMRFMIDGFFYTNEKYNELVDFITSIHQNVRELSHRMQPTQLKNLGLKATIGELADTINRSKRFKLDFETNIEKRLPDKLELNIYYLINELVNNATKHSNGSAINVQLYEEENNIISLSVEDDGSGFNPKEASKGMGLKNIESRLKYLGGTLLIESSGTDTQFFIEIPIKP